MIPRAALGVPRVRQADVRGKGVVGRETGRDACQLAEASNQQTGADQEHHRQRKLGDHENAPDAPSGALSGLSSAGGEQLAQIKT